MGKGAASFIIRHGMEAAVPLSFLVPRRNHAIVPPYVMEEEIC